MYDSCAVVVQKLHNRMKGRLLPVTSFARPLYDEEDGRCAGSGEETCSSLWLEYTAATQRFLHLCQVDSVNSVYDCDKMQPLFSCIPQAKYRVAAKTC